MKTADFSYMQVEPVGQCNLRCQMCPIQFRRDGPPYGPPALMDFKVFKRLVDGSAGLTDLHLQGLGEPLIHPLFFDMVSYAAGRGIKVSTNTNFTLSTPERARRLVNSGLRELHISLDGATKGTYETIRQGADWEIVQRNIAEFLKVRREMDSATPSVRIVMVIMRKNLEELPDLVRLVHGHGIDSIFAQHLAHDFGESSLPPHYKPMRDFVEEQTLLNEDPGKVKAYFGEAAREAARLGVDLRLPSLKPAHGEDEALGADRCDWPWKGPYVSYQGYAMPCCMVATPDRANMGDMGLNGPQAVWRGASYRDFRDRLSSPNPPEVCKTCAVYNRTF